jgi:hypothetical protein
MKSIIVKKPELCIPRMSTDIPKEFIFHIFCRLKIGFIERITEFSLRNDTSDGGSGSGGSHKCVIVRLKWNLSTDRAKYMYDRLMRGEPIFIVYNTPFYWKVVVNQTTPTDNMIVPPPAYTASHHDDVTIS